MKELWCFQGNRISVRFEYEWRDADNPGQWMRTRGNEHWEFDDDGLMRRRGIGANDYPIGEADRRVPGSRPDIEGGVGILPR